MQFSHIICNYIQTSHLNFFGTNRSLSSIYCVARFTETKGEHGYQTEVWIRWERKQDIRRDCWKSKHIERNGKKTRSESIDEAQASCKSRLSPQASCMKCEIFHPGVQTAVHTAIINNHYPQTNDLKHSICISLEN